jgi:thiamine monophosphate kinase
MRIEGEVAQFLFRNPHSMIHVSAPDASGDVRRWAIEWAGVGTLSGEGVSRETLRIGDHVIVSGNPGRNAADYRLRLLSIERPLDGWKWQGRFD